MAQRNITTNSGQKIIIMPDNSWAFQSSVDAINAMPDDEMSYPSYLTKNSIENIRLLRSAADKKEVEMFLIYDKLEKDLDIKKLQLSHSKIMKNKANEKQITLDIKDQKQKIAAAEHNYKTASLNVAKSKKLKSADEKKLIIEMSELSLELGVKINTIDLPVSETNIKHAPDPKSVKEKKQGIIKDHCEILTDKSDGKTRYVEMKSENFFNFTPQNLKSYFKDKELMTTNVSVISENKVKKLRLSQKLISKDAAKNYGYIPLEGLLRITLITGKKIDLYASERSSGEIEFYTGNAIYKTDYLLTEEAVSGLENAPIDTLGMMWSSGFETYTIYKVDAIMNQLTCLQSLLK